MALMQNSFINTVTAKNEFNALVAKINKDKKPVIVAKRGEPVAVLLDYNTYQGMTEQATQSTTRANLTQRLQAFQEYQARAYPHGQSDDSVTTLKNLREGHIK